MDGPHRAARQTTAKSVEARSVETGGGDTNELALVAGGVDDDSGDTGQLR